MAIRRLRFPVGGLNRRYGYQTQPPFTTADCLNVRPFDSQEGRERGGSRPGLATVFNDPIESGASGLFTVDVVPLPGTSRAVWREGFDHPIGNDWTTIGVHPVIDGSMAWFSSPPGGALQSTLIRNEFENFDPVKFYSLSMYCRGNYQQEQNATYWLMAGVLNPLNLWSDALMLRVMLREAGPVFRIDLQHWWSGNIEQSVSVDMSQRYHVREPFKLELTVNDRGPSTGGIGIVSGRIYFMGNQYTTGDMRNLEYVPVDLSGLGTRSGLAVTPEAGHFVRIEDFTQRYAVTTDPFFDKPRPVLVAVGSNGRLRSNREPGTMTEPTDDPPSLSENTPKSAAAFVGRLYIADPAGDGYGPMVFDPTENTLNPWETEEYTSGPYEGQAKGTVPQGCHLLTRYSGRMVLAGEPDHGFWMSRAGNPLDFDYAVDPSDSARAADGQSVDAEWGALSGALTALISFSDDYLLFGQRDAISRLVGPPYSGGRIVNVSQAVGILDRFAWCVTPETELVFLGSEGLFSLAPGGASFPVPISQELLPDELKDIDPLNNRIILVYDRVDVGIHIFIVPTAGGGTRHWWFDWRTRGFSPVSLRSEYVPNDAVWYDGDGITPPGVILACRDGYLSGFSNASEDDRGVPFVSYCDYGPVRLAPADSRTGVLNSIRVFNPAFSGKVNIKARVGGSAEEAFSAPVAHSEQADGRAIRVKRGGSSAYIRVSGTGRAWQMENVEVDVATVGPAKPL